MRGLKMKKNKLWTPKTWISIALLLASLAWLVKTSATNAVARTGENEAAFLAPTASPTPSPTPTRLPRAYLPVAFQNYCYPFLYNETLRFNMSIINAPKAWNCTPAGKGVVIAIIDTGADLDHVDLQANLVAGWNFVAGNATPEDDNGHGSHVAGIAAGVANNGGILGVAPKANIMPLKVLDNNGSGSTANVAAAVIWAADHGADVINMSLGGSANPAALVDAINYAYNKGIPIIVAAGNCGDSYYSYNGCTYMNQPRYPAALDTVVAVAATTSSDTHASFSNANSYVDISAPGTGIYSASKNAGYATHDGTSQACPHVAGLAALLWSQHPTWTRSQVITQIYNTATDLGTAGRDDVFGYGRINANTAVGAASLNPPAGAAPKANILPPAADNTAPYMPGVILVGLKAGYSMSAVLAEAGFSLNALQTEHTLEKIGVYKLTVPAGQESSLVEQLLKTPGVQYAELDTIFTAQ
jgi:hypothetical protein